MDDLRRFAGYNISLSRRHKMPFTTVILTKGEVSAKAKITGSVAFTPTIINLNEKDAKAVLGDIKAKLAAGQEINELELVFLPLYNKSGMTHIEVYEAIIEALPVVAPDKRRQERLLSLALLLGNKFIPEPEYNNIMEMINMSFEDNKFFKFFREKTTREIAENFLKNGVSVDIVKESSELSDSDIAEIQNKLSAAANG